MRPPMVRRSSGVPSRGHTAPRLAGAPAGRPCGCRPGPRAAASVRRRSGGAGSPRRRPGVPAARAGSSPARHRISSASRLPMPATRRWSSSTALTGALTPASAGGQLPAGDRERVGPERGLVGPELDAAQPAGVVHGAASRRRRRSGRSAARPGRSGRARTPARRSGMPPSTSEPAGHAEPQAEDRAVGVQHEQLAAAAHGRDLAARSGRRRASSGAEAALQEPGIGRATRRRSCVRPRPRPPAGSAPPRGSPARRSGEPCRDLGASVLLLGCCLIAADPVSRRACSCSGCRGASSPTGSARTASSSPAAWPSCAPSGARSARGPRRGWPSTATTA